MHLTTLLWDLKILVHGRGVDLLALVRSVRPHTARRQAGHVSAERVLARCGTMVVVVLRSGGALFFNVRESRTEIRRFTMTAPCEK